MAGTVLLGAAGAVADHPTLLHTGRGALMAALKLAYLAWYWLLMRVRRQRRWPGPEAVPEILRAYVILGAGLALTAALYRLDSSFSSMTFVIIGIIPAAIPGRPGLLPMAVGAVLFLFEFGPLGHPRNALDAAGSLFELTLTLGLAYTMAALIRERRRGDELIAELRAAHRRLRISTAREIELAALRERNRLAREMHDSLGHALVLIAIKIEAAQRLQAVDPARAATEWEDTKALVRSTMTDLRNSLAGLRLPALEEQPFCEAMADLASELGRRAGIAVASSVDEEAATLDRSTQEALYRVAQEGLANVAKHAHAHHAALSLAVKERTAVLEVSDDGVGLGAASRNGRGHYGVLGMRERVEELGGVLTLGPRPDGGTLLRACVPIKEGSDARHPHLVG